MDKENWPITNGRNTAKITTLCIAQLMFATISFGGSTRMVYTVHYTNTARKGICCCGLCRAEHQCWSPWWLISICLFPTAP